VCFFQSSIGRPDEAVAAEALANHTRCNNSYIYDLFQALYRSSLTCPGCHHRSNTFDPFLSVSLVCELRWAVADAARLAEDSVKLTYRV
jgi:ubiquitin C-terminal hydrolase